MAFATTRLARSLTKPTKADLIASRRLLRYHCSSLDPGMKIKMHNKACATLTVFTDSDWASDRPTRKSVSSR